MIGLSMTDADRIALEALKVDPRLLEDDHQDYSGKTVPKPWGFEYEVRNTQEFSVWRLSIDAGAETSMHCHPGKTLLLHAEFGGIKLCTLGGEVEMKQGELALIERGVFHSIVAPSGATVVELEWPSNRCDIVRLRDRYGRARTGYASS